MDRKHLTGARPERVTSPDRRLIAVGTITRRGGRTLTVRATPAGVTGTIRANDACPLCGRWSCTGTCTPWPGKTTTVALTGGQR